MTGVLELSASEVTWILTALAACGLGLTCGLWWWSGDARQVRWPRGGLPILIVLSLVSLPVYFYATRWVSWSHDWDLFHTVMGAKYHRELGYFRLYDCVVERDARGRRFFDHVPRVRDLSRNRKVERQRIVDAGRCGDRFSPQRGQAFDRDLAYFQEQLPRSRWKRLLRDKGYNGSPFYTAVAGTILGFVPLSEDNLVALGLIDPILILLAFASLGWAAGPHVALLALLFFCANFPNRFEHMGGSLLRFDYVAYLLAGLSAMRRGRYAVSGALLGLSTMVRIFPGVFVAGYGIHALLAALRRRRVAMEDLRFFGGFSAVAGACFGFSLAVGGLDAWREFFQNLQIHTGRIAGYRIGFKCLFMLGTGDEGWRDLAARNHLFDDTRPLFWLAAALFGAVLLWLAPRMRAVDYTVVFGLVGFYVATAATRYYYSVLVVLFVLVLSDRRARVRLGLWAGIFAVSLSAFLAIRLDPGPAFPYNGWMSAALFAFYVAALGTLVWGYRQGPVRRESRASVP